MTIVSVYVIFANQAEAETIGRAIVDERLAACINILAPCRSIYRWQGKVEQAEEVPAITVWPVHKALATYADWVEDEVATHAPR